MKIVRIETTPVEIPMLPDKVMRTSLGIHDRSLFALVRVHTDEGLTGLGEVSSTPNWSGEDGITASHLIRTRLEPALLGENPTHIEKLSRRMNHALAGNPFAKAGVEMALWDLLGKEAGLPLYRLLGGPVRDFVTTKFSISGAHPERAAETARWAMEQGFKTVKVKVGLGPNEDYLRVKAVREAIGAEVRLGIDANGGWSTREAIREIGRLSEFGLIFAEQPVSPVDVTWLADVRRQVNIPVMADESVFTLQDAMSVARAGAADILSVYVGKGGIGAARKIAAVAEAAGLTCTVGSNIEIGIASAAMIHLAMATPGIGAEDFPCDIIGPFYYGTDLLKEPLNLKGGEARPPEKPGLGVELDEAAVDRFTVR